ncbi:hypothetical protein COLO4_19354 [Corchorus olitorius]|uniref:Uncharacterized protein n=1 Tax=Corchorus olitorius TaxID=93759 RepID=A0A1R3J5K2_9ROSI|nr:hypothetical protein COLO4_19354 [Corchorus olitorius]
MPDPGKYWGFGFFAIPLPAELSNWPVRSTWGPHARNLNDVPYLFGKEQSDYKRSSKSKDASEPESKRAKESHSKECKTSDGASPVVNIVEDIGGGVVAGEAHSSLPDFAKLRQKDLGVWHESLGLDEDGHPQNRISLTLPLSKNDRAYDPGANTYLLARSMILSEDQSALDDLKANLTISAHAFAHASYKQMFAGIALAEALDKVHNEHSNLDLKNGELSRSLKESQEQLGKALASCTSFQKERDDLKLEMEKMKEELERVIREKDEVVTCGKQEIEEAKKQVVAEYKSSPDFSADSAKFHTKALKIGFGLCFEKVRLDFPKVRFPNYSCLEVAKEIQS